MSSSGTRVEKTAPYAICSILNQSVSPDKIILWLSYNTPVPPVLTKLSEIGLEIRFCKDLKSYKKLVPALQEFPEDILITAEDNVFYPKNWFSQLKEAYIKDPLKIHAHSVFRILFNMKNEVLPFNEWAYCEVPVKQEETLFATGAGGVLYPPKSLDSRCIKERDFLVIAPTEDDVWFWAMARLKGTKYSIVKNGYSSINSIDNSNGGIWDNNKRNGGIDQQLKKALKKFPMLLSSIRPQRLSVMKQTEARIPKISVIMPCYNCEKYVGKAIQSILSQTFENFEFIIINDGSTDNSEKEINNYLEDPRIKYHALTKNRGNYPARNMGIYMAKGKYIAVMDSDDISDINRLLLQFDYMEANPNIGCIGSQGYWINEQDEIIGNLNIPTDYRRVKINLLRNNFTLHPSLMFRNSFLKKYKLSYNEDFTYSADYDLVARASHLFKISNLPNRLLKYRFHDSQISSKKRHQQMQFADTIRFSQLNRLGVFLQNQEVEAYQRIMKGQISTEAELAQCLDLFNKILDQNQKNRLFVNKHLYEFFEEILFEVNSRIERRTGGEM